MFTLHATIDASQSPYLSQQLSALSASVLAESPSPPTFSVGNAVPTKRGAQTSLLTNN